MKGSKRLTSTIRAYVNAKNCLMITKGERECECERDSSLVQAQAAGILPKTNPNRTQKDKLMCHLSLSSSSSMDDETQFDRYSQNKEEEQGWEY